MQDTQTLGLVDERLLLSVAQQSPDLPQSATDLSVVHVGIVQRHLPALQLSPNHEGVHGSLDVFLATELHDLGLLTGGHARAGECTGGRRVIVLHHAA